MYCRLFVVASGKLVVLKVVFVAPASGKSVTEGNKLWVNAKQVEQKSVIDGTQARLILCIGNFFFVDPGVCNMYNRTIIIIALLGK